MRPAIHGAYFDASACMPQTIQRDVQRKFNLFGSYASIVINIYQYLFKSFIQCIVSTVREKLLFMSKDELRAEVMIILISDLHILHF